MSQGGFLSFDLACNLSTTFAAIAPVSAGMAPALVESCMPSRPVPVLQTHGTEDDLVGYDTGQSAIQWWVDFNMTDATPSVTELPDPFPTNGTTVERFVYSNGEAGSSVEHLRINGGGHGWPGSDGNSDIDFAEQVWSFLSRYGLDGPLTD